MLSKVRLGLELIQIIVAYATYTGKVILTWWKHNIIYNNTQVTVLLVHKVVKINKPTNKFPVSFSGKVYNLCCCILMEIRSKIKVRFHRVLVHLISSND